ncbi:MAG: hypothetical protein V4534_09015 [Myxococcota bacterium]
MKLIKLTSLIYPLIFIACSSGNRQQENLPAAPEPVTTETVPSEIAPPDEHPELVEEDSSSDESSFSTRFSEISKTCNLTDDTSATEDDDDKLESCLAQSSDDFDRDLLRESVPKAEGYFKWMSPNRRMAEGEKIAQAKYALAEPLNTDYQLDENQFASLRGAVEQCAQSSLNHLFLSLQRDPIGTEKIINSLKNWPTEFDGKPSVHQPVAAMFANAIPSRLEGINAWKLRVYNERSLMQDRVKKGFRKVGPECKAAQFIALDPVIDPSRAADNLVAYRDRHLEEILKTGSTDWGHLIDIVERRANYHELGEIPIFKGLTPEAVIEILPMPKKVELQDLNKLIKEKLNQGSKLQNLSSL